jgi:hypothetical protein
MPRSATLDLSHEAQMQILTALGTVWACRNAVPRSSNSLTPLGGCTVRRAMSQHRRSAKLSVSSSSVCREIDFLPLCNLEKVSTRIFQAAYTICYAAPSNKAELSLSSVSKVLCPYTATVRYPYRWLPEHLTSAGVCQPVVQIA